MEDNPGSRGHNNRPIVEQTEQKSGELDGQPVIPELSSLVETILAQNPEGEPGQPQAFRKDDPGHRLEADRTTLSREGSELRIKTTVRVNNFEKGSIVQLVLLDNQVIDLVVKYPDVLGNSDAPIEFNGTGPDIQRHAVAEISENCREMNIELPPPEATLPS